MARGLWPLSWGAGICKAKPKNPDSLSPEPEFGGTRGPQGENHGPCQGSSAVTLPRPPSDRVQHRRTPAPRKKRAQDLVYTYSLC